MSYNYPACSNRLKYYPVFLLSNKYGIPCVWAYYQTKCFTLGVEFTIVNDQAATSDDKHDEISSCSIYAYIAYLTCRLIKKYEVVVFILFLVQHKAPYRDDQNSQYH